MDINEKNKLRSFLKSSLEEYHDQHELHDDDSLFVSGRLDSLAMTNLVVYLENEFDVNFADVAFEVDLIDSIQEIEAFLQDAPTIK